MEKALIIGLIDIYIVNLYIEYLIYISTNLLIIIKI